MWVAGIKSVVEGVEDRSALEKLLAVIAIAFGIALGAVAEPCLQNAQTLVNKRQRILWVILSALFATLATAESSFGALIHIAPIFVAHVASGTALQVQTGCNVLLSGNEDGRQNYG